MIMIPPLPFIKIKGTSLCQGTTIPLTKVCISTKTKKLEYYFSTFILKSHLDLFSIKAVKVSLKNHTTFQHSIALHSESYGYKKTHELQNLRAASANHWWISFSSSLHHHCVFSRSYYFVSKPLNLKCSSKTRDNRKPNFQLHFKTRLYLLLS